MTTSTPAREHVGGQRWELSGLVALVTGAASGIGAACARLLDLRGAQVIRADASWTEPGDHLTVDVANDNDCRRMARTALDRFGRLDIAVNAAGIAGPKAKVANYPIRAFDTVMSVNLRGTFLCLRSELGAMTWAGNGGAIVNISSVLGSVGAPEKIAYVAAKHAVEGMTRTAALDYADEGVRINCVAPGYIDTPMISAQSHTDPSVIGSHPSGRLGTADEVAHLAVFLASPAASNCTGAVFACDGGYTSR